MRWAKMLNVVTGEDLEVIGVDMERRERNRDWRPIAALTMAAVATASLVVIGVAGVRLVRQGERRECVERSNALASLEVLGEPDGRSSQKVAAERFGACYGLSEAPPASATSVVAPVVRRCPNTEHSFERPALADESGDALPMSGTVTRAAAERIAAARPASARPRVVAVEGRAWTRDATGQVSIKDESLYVVELQVRDVNDCPRQPVFEGVPLTFYYAIP